MSGPLKCRVPVTGDAVMAVDCGKPAAVGLVTEYLPDHRGEQRGEPEPILELVPLCELHAPEIIHEQSISSAAEDWAVVTLAYGASGGDLR